MDEQASASSSYSSSSTSSSQLQLLTRLPNLFEHDGSHQEALQLVKNIAKRSTAQHVTTRGDSDPDATLKGLSLRYTVNLQPSLSKAISSTHSALKRTIKEHEILAFKDRQRWLRQKEEIDTKKELNQGSSRPQPKLELQPPWEPLLGDRNLQDVLSILLNLQQAPDDSTHAHAVLLTSGSTSRAYLSRQDQNRVDKALWDSIFQEEPLSGEGWKSYASNSKERKAEQYDGLESEGWASEEEEPKSKPKSSRKLEKEKAFILKEELEFRRKEIFRSDGRKKFDREKLKAEIDEDRLKGLESSFYDLEKTQYWKNLHSGKQRLSETQAIGECFFALEGLISVLFQRKKTSTRVSSAASSIRPTHLSESTFQSLLEEVAIFSTTLDRLRSFVSLSKSQHISSKIEFDLVLRSLGDSVASLLSKFQELLLRWREDIASLSSNRKTIEIGDTGDRTITLANLITEMETNGQALRALEDLLIDSGALQDEETSDEALPLDTSAKVLDALQASISFYWSLYDCSSAVTSTTSKTEKDLEEENQHSVEREVAFKTAEDLSQCFLAAAEPIWEEVKLWVGEGMEIRLDEDQMNLVEEGEEEREIKRRASSGAGRDGEVNQQQKPKTSRNESFLPCFARRDRNIAAQDGRFWKEGWSISNSTDSNSGRVAPYFISSLSRNVLDAGKCVGLLRALGWEAEILAGDNDAKSSNSLREILVHSSLKERSDSAQVFNESESSESNESKSSKSFLHELLFGSQTSRSQRSSPEALEIKKEDEEIDLTLKWSPSLQQVVSSSYPPSLSSSSSSTSSPPPSPSFESDGSKFSQAPLSQILSTNAFNFKLSSYLEPRLTLVQRRLHDVLTSGWEEQGCDLPAHVEGFLGLFLWRRGREISQWSNVIFEQVDDGKNSVFDSQFLNAAFREEVVSSASCGGGAWIDTSLVRFVPARKASRSRGIGDWFVGSGIRSLAAIRVHYLVPFPLTYFFTPSIQLHYQSIFTLQLQFSRAQYLLSRMSPTRPGKISEDSEFIYNSEGAMNFVQIRKRLLWIVRILSDFISRDIFEIQTQSLLSGLSNLVSYDSLIDLHSSSIKRITALCFLREFPSPKQASFETETDSESISELRSSTDLHELILDVLDCADEVAASYRKRTGFGAANDEEDLQTKQRASRRRRRRRKEKAARIKAHQLDQAGNQNRKEEEEEESDDDENENAEEETDESNSKKLQFRSQNLEIPISNPNLSFSFSISGTEEPFLIQMKRLNLGLEKDVERIKAEVQEKIGLAASRGEMEARGDWQGLAYSLEEWI